MKSLAVIAILSFSLTGCIWKSSEVVVHNESGGVVSNVTVLVGGQVLHVDAIPRSETKVVSFIPEADSALVIEYQMEKTSGRSRCHGDVYITGGDWARFDATLLPGGKCKVLDTSPRG